MKDINKIIKVIDEFLEDRNQKTTTPVEINAHLEELDLCPDSKSRPGKPFRELLRKDQLPHAYKIGKYWFVPHSSTIL